MLLQIIVRMNNRTIARSTWIFPLLEAAMERMKAGLRRIARRAASTVVVSKQIPFHNKITLFFEQFNNIKSLNEYFHTL